MTDDVKSQPGRDGHKEAIELWANISKTLQSADQLPPKRKRWDELHKAIQVKLQAGPDPKAREQLRKENDTVQAELVKTVQEELRAYEQAIEDLQLLRALMGSAPDAPDSSKRRRTGAGSPSSSLTPSPPPAVHSPRVSPTTVKASSPGPSAADVKKAARASPPHAVGDTSTGSAKSGNRIGEHKGKGKGWRKGMTQVPASTPVNMQTTATTTLNTLSSAGGYLDPAKARREQLASQLPLQKGRKVAFRQPTTKKADHPAPGPSAGPSGGEEDGETWILATVIDCINNDRNRYVVQDAEEGDKGAGPTWNTTLKAIVPLPESVMTMPQRDYPVGHRVLALYPDTSCFYQATIKGGGPGMQKIPPKTLQKRETELLNSRYNLTFDDDEDDVKSIPAYYVVERPRL